MICYEKDGVQMIVNENMVRVMESCGYKRVVEKTAPSSVQIPDPVQHPPHLSFSEGSYKYVQQEQALPLQIRL